MSGYFDYNATAPLSPVGRKAWLDASDRHWHNPSSLYHDAGFARQKLEEARERLATLLDCEAERIVFTSGATESNNALFAGLASAWPGDARVALSPVEHPCVSESAARYFPVRVRRVPVNAEGVVEPDAVVEIIESYRPALVSVMAAGNESGTLMPWQEIAAVCRKAGVLFHTDAAQWIGKLPARGLGACDYVTGSAHKFGGAKGAGFMVLRDPPDSLRLLFGGPQENEHRAGTENYPAIESMVTALESLEPELPSIGAEQAAHRDVFISTLRDFFPGLRVISQGAPRLWNTVLMVMPRHENLKWLTRLSRRGFSISTGSACSSGKEGSSVVVTALGADWDELKRVVRVSGGWGHTAADWTALATAFAEVGAELDGGIQPKG